MARGLIVFMVLILWGPALLYLGYRLIRMFSPRDGKQHTAPPPHASLQQHDTSAQATRLSGQGQPQR